MSDAFWVFVIGLLVLGLWEIIKLAHIVFYPPRVPTWEPPAAMANEPELTDFVPTRADEAECRLDS